MMCEFNDLQAIRIAVGAQSQILNNYLINHYLNYFFFSFIGFGGRINGEP